MSDSSNEIDALIAAERDHVADLAEERASAKRALIARLAAQGLADPFASEGNPGAGNAGTDDAGPSEAGGAGEPPPGPSAAVEGAASRAAGAALTRSILPLFVGLVVGAGAGSAATYAVLSAPSASREAEPRVEQGPAEGAATSSLAEVATGQGESAPESTEREPAAPEPPPPEARDGRTPRLRERSDRRGRRASRESTAEEPREPSIARERRLIDRAQAAFGHGRFDEALVPLMRHAREFPAGALTEEREALLIRALFGRGDRERSAERGARFLERFPNSLYAETVARIVRPELP